MIIFILLVAPNFEWLLFQEIWALKLAQQFFMLVFFFRKRDIRFSIIFFYLKFEIIVRLLLFMFCYQVFRDLFMIAQETASSRHAKSRRFKECSNLIVSSGYQYRVWKEYDAPINFNPQKIKYYHEMKYI